MNFNLSGHYQNSSSTTEYKGGTIKNWSQISCTWGRRGGKWVIRTLQSLKGGSDKFFRDTNKILHPPPRDKYWSVSNHNLLYGIILSFVNNLEKLISNLTYISSLEFPQSGLKWRMLSCNWTCLFASTFEKNYDCMTLHPLSPWLKNIYLFCFYVAQRSIMESVCKIDTNNIQKLMAAMAI